MKNAGSMEKTTRQANLLDQVNRISWESLGGVTVDVLDQIKDGIVFLAPPLDTVPSPAGNAIYTIVQDLVERSPVPSLVLAIWPAQGNPQACNISDKILYCKEPFKRVPLEPYLPYRLKKILWGSGRPELIEYARKAALLCNLLHPKVIIVEDVPLFGYILKRNLKISAQILLHQHNDAPLGYSTPWWNKIKKAYSGMVFVARKSIQEVEKKHGNLSNATVVYNGVDLSHYDPQIWFGKAQELRDQYAFSDKDTVLLYVGRITPGKGVRELAEAFLEVNIPNTRLVIIGNLASGLFSTESFSAALKQLIESSNNKIIAAGVVPQQEIPAWYVVSDMVVVPSLQSEGLPKVVTEALAMGKPVLASDRGGSFELIKPGENGWLLEDPKNIVKFSSQLWEILQDHKEILQFGNNAFTHDRIKLGIEKSSKDFFDFVLY